MNSIVVLLSAYNGSKFLKEQLDSLEAQVGVEMSILVRDDGSTDGTQELLDRLGKKRLTWYQGENLGPALSFMELVYDAPQADYYAFCDQDDVWMPDKLITAIKKLKEGNADFYYSSYTTVDSELNVLQENVHHHHKDALGASLVNLEVTGCTVVFTNRLLNEIRYYRPHYIMMHDSWVYKIALALGYNVVYDPHAHIYYRQHNNNVVGDKKSIIKRWQSRYNRWVKDITNNRYKEAEELYRGYEDLMTNEALKVVEPLIGYKEKSILKRFIISSKSLYSTGMFKTDLAFVLSFITKRY